MGRSLTCLVLIGLGLLYIAWAIIRDLRRGSQCQE